MQKVSDARLELCEVCGGKLEKQISLSGFQFKGAGWYVTDYAAKKGAAEKSGKTETAEKSEKTSASESTADASGASNKSTDASTTAAVSKIETPAKKD